MLYSFAFPVWKAMLQQLTHTHSLAPRLVFGLRCGKHHRTPPGEP